ncbi:hypothetical protein Aau02nite_85770 [Amorphoplanes auranticolor]|uniref:Uncharacterized protein n=1 Tax=Actinoplanes auranticolor TaxID=47988 RepID=A0A919VUI2_9ACTN|nr:hypothetical protein Aau02nite_85770 [Actinoplanes auranticolor]
MARVVPPFAADDPGQVAAEDLQLGGGAVRVLDREPRYDAALAVEDARALLGGAPAAYRLLEPHPVEDVAGGAPHVDVLPAVPERDRLLGGLRDHGVAFAELGRHFGTRMGLHTTDANAVVEILSAEERGTPLTQAALSRRID